MKNCWLINFKNGYKVILSEEKYRKHYLKETPKEEVMSEEHWFEMKNCISNNPEVDIIE